MAYQEPVQVSIDLNTSFLTRASFDIPIFVGSHSYFTERVRTYSNLLSVGEAFPSNSKEYIAAQNYFAQTPSPSTLKIGRRQTDQVEITLDPITAGGQVYSLTLLGTDGVEVTSTFVTTAIDDDNDPNTPPLLPTPENVISTWQSELASVAGVSLSGTNTLIITRTGTENFAILDIKRAQAVGTSTESAPDLVEAILEEDNEWYAMTCDDKSKAFIEAMAANINALSKVYV